MVHWLSHAFGTYVLHAQRGNGYQWWSGAGSDLGEATLVGVALGYLKHHTCHQKGCWRLGHPDPKHGHPACRRHHGRELKA